MTKHVCPAPRCGESLPPHVFACRRHWRALPAELQRKVVKGWRSADAGAYLSAHREAVAWLAANAV